VATLVWGHGLRDRGEEKTFVPDGTTVKWYSDVDQYLITANGFVAVSSGAFGNPNDQQGPGNGTQVEVFNYRVAPDLEKRDYVALLNRDGHDLKFVGAEVNEGYLCNDVAGCRARGSHACDGVFGLVHDQELIILACRGVAGMRNAATAAYGRDAADPLASITRDTSVFVQGFARRVMTDPISAEREFDNLSDPVKILLTGWDTISAWESIRWAADAGRKGDVSGLFTQLQSQLNNADGERFLTVTYYLQGLETGAQADPELFFNTLAAHPGNLTAKIATLGPIVAVKTQLDKKKAAFARSWVPNDTAFAAITQINSQNVKSSRDGKTMTIVAGGVLVLIGPGHNQQAVNYVKTQGDEEHGTLTVTKGSAFSKGGLAVTGISAKQPVVKLMISKFSEKSVTFA
jgi:hypothetical protein